jgi:tetratricopeptide (TPR) repeat protein
MLKRIQTLILVFSFILICLCSCRKEPTSFDSYSKQKQLIDTLLQQTREARNDTPSIIVEMADSSIRLSQKINYIEGEIKGMYNKATGYFYQSQYDKSAEWCQLVLEKIKISSVPALDSLNKYKLLGSAYILLGILSQRQGKYEDANKYLLTALADFEKIEHWENIATTYNNISENFRFIKNFDKALKYNQTAEEYYILAKKSDRIPLVLQNRGNIYFDQGKYQKALETFTTTLKEAEKYNDIENIVNALNNIGASYEKIGQDEIAIQNYLKALEIYQERQNYWGETNTLGNISAMYLKSGDFETAIQISETALEIAEKHHFLALEKYISENLAKIYETRGDFEKSLNIYKKVIVLNDSLYNQQKFESINLLEQQYNEEKAKRLFAQKDKTITEAKLKSQKLKNFISILSFLIILSLITTLLLYRQAKFRKLKNDELISKNNIIQQQNEDLEALVNAYESQREKRIEIGNQKILFDDIIYIRYQDRVSSIFLKQGKVINHRIQLSQLLSELNYKSHFIFSQINQNYILNFKNIHIDFFDGEEEKYYYTSYLPGDITEGRNEDYIKTRKRSGLNKNFEREYHRFLRIQQLLSLANSN